MSFTERLNTILIMAEVIRLMEYPDNVRNRFGMYGGTTENCTNLLREIIDNSIDEGLKSDKLSFIKIYDYEDHYIVMDDGRGIPLAKSIDDPTLTQAELAISKLHAGSNFTDKSASIGLNGVGAAVVNAVSDRYIVAIQVTDSNHGEFTDSIGSYYVLEYSKGLKVSTDIMSLKRLEDLLGHEVGEFNTLTYFKPDLTVMESPIAKIPNRQLRIYKYVRDKSKVTSIYVNDKLLDVESILFDHTINVKLPCKNKYNSTIDVTVSFEFNEDLTVTRNRGAVNTLVVNKGVHIDLVKDTLLAQLKKVFNIQHDNLGSGLEIFVSVIGNKPAYTSQTKERLCRLAGLDKSILGPLANRLSEYFRSHKRNFEEHVERLKLMNDSVNKARKLKLIKKTLSITSKSTQVRNSNTHSCTSSNRSGCELFIVEGNSAGGNLLKVRDSSKHALFFLRGKPLNSTGMSILNVLKNDEMRNLVSTIGIGVSDCKNMKGLQYGKIIIVADADPDGASIASLLVGFFCKHMKFAIDKGLIYVCETPIYIQGDTYIYPSDPKNKLNKSKDYLRIKGLGELPAPITKEVILNPEHRRLIQITSEDSDKAIKLSNSGVARKRLIKRCGLLVDDYPDYEEDLISTEQINESEDE